MTFATGSVANGYGCRAKSYSAALGHILLHYATHAFPDTTEGAEAEVVAAAKEEAGAEVDAGAKEEAEAVVLAKTEAGEERWAAWARVEGEKTKSAGWAGGSGGSKGAAAVLLGAASEKWIGGGSWRGPWRRGGWGEVGGGVGARVVGVLVRGRWGAEVVGRMVRVCVRLVWLGVRR